MSRPATAVVAIWASALLLSVALLFLGTQVAPCLGGGVGPGAAAIRDRCVAEWRPSQLWFERFSAETPTSILLVLTWALGATGFVQWWRKRRTVSSSLTADSSDLHKPE